MPTSTSSSGTVPLISTDRPPEAALPPGAALPPLGEWVLLPFMLPPFMSTCESALPGRRSAVHGGAVSIGAKRPGSPGWWRRRLERARVRVEGGNETDLEWNLLLFDLESTIL